PSNFRRTPGLFNKALAKVFGTSNERAVKRMLPTVARINELEPSIKALSDEQLRAKTAEFKQRVVDHVAAQKIDAADAGSAAGIRPAEQEALDEILPEAFAIGRGGCRRAGGQGRL